MTQLTVFDSFHRSLPPFPIAPEADNYRRISPSSKSTKEQKPLRTWRQETYMVLLENAERFLLDDESKARGVLSKYSSLITNTYILRTEADVLGASVLHLFHDINITLNKGFRHGTIRMEHEKSKKSGRLRTDVSWAFYPHQGRPQEIAALELKAPSILTWEDFAGAVARNDEEEKDKLRRTEGPSHITLLLRNAKCCIQQLMKYAKSLNIKDVALFDWNYLFIIDIHGLNEDARRPRLARGIWYKEKGKAHTSGDTFHTMLLGFILRAISRYPQIRWAGAIENSSAVYPYHASLPLMVEQETEIK